ncbi:hypothetical protein EJ05DRAFT_257673 [Pseudovirgaria hyperparasitica]|uniref:Uncharacterized protein n=1 Tax=Pseudovirgaria hyperparasitica TaxID=470096 RepID=A0A6A6WJ16_9PEZI|nr:uncharacterized protein EJ05DRAFT_257673 [Pseudovirgaria hyperparasitica]KAF2761251.1 hypothetical protein EJ05DRAFT_257673 [Pseudovirgaria hyperparasitica]
MLLLCIRPVAAFPVFWLSWHAYHFCLKPCSQACSSTFKNRVCRWLSEACILCRFTRKYHSQAISMSSRSSFSAQRSNFRTCQAVDEQPTVSIITPLRQEEAQV